jgi:hypothetical protein
MWFEGKCMQLKDIMLSELNQVQKDKDFLSYVEYRSKR